MPIAKIHTKGLPPLDQPVAGKAIEQRLREEEERRNAEHAANRSDTPARLIASDAYKCSRQIAFRVLGVPKDVKYTPEQLMTFRAGDWYHGVVSEAVIRFLNARTEVEYDYRPRADLYGRGDLVYEDEIGVVAGEVKSQAGYGFDLAVGARRSDTGPGPKIDHCIQGGLLAMSPQVRAGRVHIIYVNKDRGVVAEWIIGLDDPLPHIAREALLGFEEDVFAEDDRAPAGPTIRRLVRAEVRRQTNDVLAVVDAGSVPERFVPGHGLVAQPARPDTREEPWNCRYCSWQPSCAAQPMDGFGLLQDDEGRLLDPLGKRYAPDDGASHLSMEAS